MILVTGGGGFIGGHLLKRLPEVGVRNVVRSNNSHQFEDYFSIGALNRSTCWVGAFSEVETVIHLAGLAHGKGKSDKQYMDVNLEGTLNFAMQAAKSGVKRFIFLSSIGVSRTGLVINESSASKPANVYIESKYMAEKELMKISQVTGMDVVVIRPTLVYGSQAPGNISRLTGFISKFIFLPFGLCKNKRSFISVGNLVSFILECLHNPLAAGEIFVVSDAKPVSTKEFTSSMAAGLGRPLIQVPIPIWLMKLFARIIGKSVIAEQLFGDLVVDCSKAKRILGWSAPESMGEAMSNLKDKSFT